VAALGVLADFALQITFFCAALSIDAKRIQQGRWDICPCKKSREVTEPRRAIVRTAFQKYYVPFLFNKKVEILVYFASIVLLTLGVLG